MRLILTLIFSILSIALHAQKVENVVLVTFDGFRWQEVFFGSDSGMMKQQQHLPDDQVKAKYWRANTEDRRRALLPFVWSTMAVKGQVYGNRAAGSQVNVTNTMWFSYPGYQEILSGFADNDRIKSNDKMYNPNETVLEFINHHTGFQGKVAAFTSWDVFPFIINDKRSGIYVNSGEVPAGEPLNEREKLLNQLMPATPNMIHEVRLDAFTFYYGMEYVKKQKPRVLYLSFDETDDFAHSGEYAAYLNSAHKTDQFLAELWDYLQSDPQYKDKTALIVTTDHGRGPGATDWKSHGAKIPGADQIWIAMMGPGITPTGESKSGQLYQNQIAATIASLLGLTYAPVTQMGRQIPVR